MASGHPLQQRLQALLRADTERLAMLTAVRQLNLPDALIAAGFVRNLVWDDLHGTKTPLNDVDVVFFDKSDRDNQRQQAASAWLEQHYPGIHWQVKNQANMHLRHGHAPYQTTLEAMGFWPEQETAIGVALQQDDTLAVVSAFSLASLFAGHITFNRRSSLAAFKARIAKKNWLRLWPQLQVRL